MDLGDHLSDGSDPGPAAAESPLKKPLIRKDRVVSKEKHDQRSKGQRGYQGQYWNQQNTKH